jgi:hypothetical protein
VLTCVLMSYPPCVYVEQQDFFPALEDFSTGAGGWGLVPEYQAATQGLTLADFQGSSATATSTTTDSKALGLDPGALMDLDHVSDVSSVNDDLESSHENDDGDAPPKKRVKPEADKAKAR